MLFEETQAHVGWLIYPGNNILFISRCFVVVFISSNELSVYDGANSHRKQNTHKVIKYAVCKPLKHGVYIRSSECYRIMLKLNI